MISDNLVLSGNDWDTNSAKIQLNLNGSAGFAGTVNGAQKAIAAGAWDLATANFWTLDAITVPVPTNMKAGMSGLIVNTAAATWPAAGGSNFQYPGGAEPAPTAFPAIIPFYCISETEIYIGMPTQGIT